MSRLHSRVAPRALLAAGLLLAAAGLRLRPANCQSGRTPQAPQLPSPPPPAELGAAEPVEVRALRPLLLQPPPDLKNGSWGDELEWLEGPNVTLEMGAPRPVSNEIETGETPNSVLISKGFTHTLTGRTGLELDISKLLEYVGAKYQISMTIAKGTQSSLSHKIALDSRSLGRVIFTENIVHVTGRVRLNSRCNFIQKLIFKRGCDSANEFAEVDVRSTQLDETGTAKGTYRVDYIGTNKFEHPEFYHLVDRFANFSSGAPGALPANGEIKSSYECATHAIRLGKPVALYHTPTKRCLLRNVRATNGTLYDRFGHTLGSYEGRLRANDTSLTNDDDEHERWVKRETCDLIHKFAAEKPDSDGHDRDHHHDDDDDDERFNFLCKNFEPRPDYVLMFQRMPQLPGVLEQLAPPAPLVIKRQQQQQQQQAAPASLTKEDRTSSAANPRPARSNSVLGSLGQLIQDLAKSAERSAASDSDSD